MRFYRIVRIACIKASLSRGVDFMKASIAASQMRLGLTGSRILACFMPSMICRRSELKLAESTSFRAGVCLPYFWY